MGLFVCPSAFLTPEKKGRMNCFDGVLNQYLKLSMPSWSLKMRLTEKGCKQAKFWMDMFVSSGSRYPAQQKFELVKRPMPPWKAIMDVLQTENGYLSVLGQPGTVLRSIHVFTDSVLLLVIFLFPGSNTLSLSLNRL